MVPWSPSPQHEQNDSAPYQSWKYKANPRAAKTPEMIQKRRTTFVSLQPFFST